jgi:hypothetical protein
LPAANATLAAIANALASPNAHNARRDTHFFSVISTTLLNYPKLARTIADDCFG